MHEQDCFARDRVWMMNEPSSDFHSISANSFNILVQKISFTWIPVSSWVQIAILNRISRLIQHFVLHKIEGGQGEKCKSSQESKSFQQIPQKWFPSRHFLINVI
jgi:hypothetical protein